MTTLPGRPRASRPSTRSAGSTLLLRAAALGAQAAGADLAGEPETARRLAAQHRRLRQRVRPGTPRQALRIAFDTGYGRAMAAAHSHA